VAPLAHGGKRVSPGAVGLVLTPGAVALAIISPRIGRLSDRVGAQPLVLAGVGAMAVSIVSISTFWAGASPVWLCIGMLGLSVGFALANPPTTNAAANALPDEQVGVGLGIFQGIFFLGGGTGPALIGAFLAARGESGAGAFNPLYGLDAAPFSDAFLATGMVLIFALIATLWLRNDVIGQVE
jgi:DHA2 family metal-tetracycline-proton antiporter-like MFS transporter/DHA2 family florfenicol/chloramphenicol resistance protein-like MFS transporter